MTNLKMDLKKAINVIKILYVAFSFFSLDAILRIETRWLGYYSIYEIAPSLFSLCWISIFIIILSFANKKLGKIMYGVTYGIWAVYVIVQYVYYLIFNKFLYLTDFIYTGEGTNYLSYVKDVININVIVIVFTFIVIGAIGVVFFPTFSRIEKRWCWIGRILFGILSLSGILCIPLFYDDSEKEALFFNSRYEYEQFTNSGFDMEITGLYQYVARDFWMSFLKMDESREELISMVDEFLGQKKEHQDNWATGLLEGKNVFIIQLESMDDWVINEKSTPAIYELMSKGINFTNMYTCLYGSGSTFSTEFAYNTGIYQGTTGVAAYSYARNRFPYTISNILNGLGYNSKSFHQNVGTYYNRENMHMTFGYEKYYMIRDYVEYEKMAEIDSTMIETDDVWSLMTGEQPFFNFIITYSAHVPYTLDNELSQYAIELHPEYLDLTENEELNILYAKARLTDELFEKLLNRLEEDNLLKDTVLIVYDDHYTYGLSNKELAHELTEANGTSIMERTPAFIWYEGCEAMVIDKVCQTIDWVPTIANLFGVDVTEKVLGSDIFDDSYSGYAIFPNGTWLTNDAYVVNGVPLYNNGLSQEEIDAMNDYVKRFYEANEAILKSDYYASQNE